MSGPTLTAPFRNSSELTKGGRTFTYIPAAEVIERLNAVLGYGNWSYRCDLVHLDSDFVVVHGHLEALGAVYEQFGGQKINKTKAGEIIDLGDDVKGAASDAEKKCAAQIGVGLYLVLGRGPTPHVVEEGESVPPKPSAPSSTPSGDDQGEKASASPSSSRRRTSAVPTSAAEKSGETGEASAGEGVRGSAPDSADAPRPYLAAPKLEEAREALKR